MFGFSKKKPKNHWSQFEGRGDSDEVLKEKAKLLAAVFIDWCKTGTLELLETLEKKGEFGQVFFEMVLFCIHYTDRIGIEFLTKEQLRIFIDALMIETETELLEAQPNEKSKSDFKVLLRVLYTENETQYSKLKIKAEEGEGLGGTLFWEFEKKILSTLNIGEDAIAMMQIHASITTLLKYIEIPTLFETR